MRNVKQTMPLGFTLIELILVVMVLAILAGVVVPLLGGLGNISTPLGPKSDRLIVTETSMRAIQDAIIGTESRPGAWTDLGRKPNLFPIDLSLLLSQVHPTAADFDPVTKIGWRGPYLRGATGSTATGTSNLVDGWGNLLKIFIPDINENSKIDRSELQYARLVSAGADGILDTVESNLEDYIPGGSDPSTGLTLEECGDDVLLFFFIADTRV